MRIFVEGDKVKVRREGIFLCLDGSEWSNALEGFYDFIKSKCRSLDIPLKIGLFSCDKEFEELPSEEFLSSSNFSKKGRFITPLMEDVFLGLKGKAYDLLVVTADRIYDWEDWRDEINLKFNNICCYSLKNLNRMSQSQLEEMLLVDVFDFKIDDVKLCFKGGIVYEFPNNLKMSFEKDECVLTGKFDSYSADIGLKACGHAGQTRLMLNVGDSAVELSIKDSLPETVALDKKLSESDTIAFLAMAEGYKKKVFEHFCPLCQNAHRFSNAFICDQRKNQGQLFAVGSAVFNEIETGRRTDSKCAIFWHRDNGISYTIFARPVISLAADEFLIASDDGHVIAAKISRSPEFYELAEIHKGLFYYPDKDIYILKMG